MRALLLLCIATILILPTEESSVADHNVFFSSKSAFYEVMKDDKAFGVAGNITFWIASKVPFIRNSFQEGEYVLKKGEKAISFLSKIMKGEALIRKITIPEGYTVKMIVEKLNNTDSLTGEITEIPEEGSLFPSTYHYRRNDSRANLINKMKAKMDSVIKQVFQNAEPGVVRDTIIMASIVEREAKLSSEKPLMASVFKNRINTGMRLQSDPTVIYALSNGYGRIAKPLSRSDLKTDSVYNTYKYKGLPPGPICCPSLDSIDAVLNPAETDFLYFILTEDKTSHKFCKEYKDHLENVNRVRRINKEMGKARKPG
ncbi:MAG: endolytic transglycosylase MltG [Holosporales bacterium]|jgi:UPF0755 protein|nr:endolytic transglycosylase MltG [Holosporales bacterium]